MGSIDSVRVILVSPDGLQFVPDSCYRGPADTPYENGVFTATLKFPKDYPLGPPIMKFTCPMFHPNSMSCKFLSLPNTDVSDLTYAPVYPDGTVCISILHPPGEDPNMYESASERWSPVQSVEKILLSVVSMLAGGLICGIRLLHMVHVSH